MVQVNHDEGVANRSDPESCADAREGIGEALTGERIGQPLSRESTLTRSRFVPGEEPGTLAAHAGSYAEDGERNPRPYRDHREG